MQEARNRTHFQKDDAHARVASRQKKKRAPRPPRRGYGGMEPLFAFRIRIKAPKRILLKVTYLASLFLAGEMSPKKIHSLSLSQIKGFFGDSIARNKREFSQIRHIPSENFFSNHLF
jgi:hypothetical protein